MAATVTALPTKNTDLAQKLEKWSVLPDLIVPDLSRQEQILGQTLQCFGDKLRLYIIAVENQSGKQTLSAEECLENIMIMKLPALDALTQCLVEHRAPTEARVRLTLHEEVLGRNCDLNDLRMIHHQTTTDLLVSYMSQINVLKKSRLYARLTSMKRMLEVL